MLEKDERKRITLAEIETHPWVTKEGRFQMDKCEGKIMVTNEDKRRALTSFGSVFAMTKIKLMMIRYVRRARRALKKAAV